MSNKVRMSAMIGGETLVIGHCLPAQARILVKKNHARWEKGGILLSIRPVHLQVALNHKKLEYEGDEVSNAELERRIEWFKTIMKAVVESDTHGSDIEHIAGPQDPDPMKRLPHTMQRIQETKGSEAYRITLSGLREGDEISPPELTEEDASWFSDAEAPDTADDVLASLWSRPDTVRFHRVFEEVDSLEAPIATSEPSQDKALVNILRAEIEDLKRHGRVMPVRFSQTSKRSPNAKWLSQLVSASSFHRSNGGRRKHEAPEDSG